MSLAKRSTGPVPGDLHSPLAPTTPLVSASPGQKVCEGDLLQYLVVQQQLRHQLLQYEKPSDSPDQLYGQVDLLWPAAIAYPRKDALVWMPPSRLVVPLASVRRSQNASHRGGGNLQKPCFGMFDRNRYTFAKIDVAFEEIVENQPEIALGLGRKIKTKCRERGACRQASSSAARPFLSPRQTRRPGGGRGLHKAPCTPGLQHPNAVGVDECPAE